MPSSTRCREVFAARQDDIEKVITGAEHGQPAARQQGGAVAQPRRCPSPWEGKNTFVGGVAKCLRPEVLWPLYKPIVFYQPLLAVLVYRLVCQPVTLESWVRLPDAALEIPIARPPRIRGGTSTDRLRANTPA